VLRQDGDEELIDVVGASSIASGAENCGDWRWHGTIDFAKGLKAYSATAIVTVADDGGSSGRLRRELGCCREIFAIVWHWQMRKSCNGTVSVSVPGREV